MKIEINVKRKHVLLVSGIVALILCSSFAGAIWDATKKLWHSADDVKVSVSGTDKSLQEAVNNDICLKSGSNCPSAPSSPETAYCNVVTTPDYNFLSQPIFREVSLMKNGRNICADGWGCTYRVWAYTDEWPSGLYLYGNTAYAFKEDASTGKWHDAYGDQTGTNGDGTGKALFNDWHNGDLWDDPGTQDKWRKIGGDYYTESDPKNSLAFLDRSNTYGFVVAVCDF